MKRLFYLLLLLATAFAHAEEKPPEAQDKLCLIYGKVGTFLVFPMAGAGIRFHKEHKGLDISAAGCGVFWNFKGLVLVYPQDRGFYVGFGPGFNLNLWDSHNWVSFESAVGYEWKNGLFFEGTLNIPLNYSHAFPCPGLTVGYGF